MKAISKQIDRKYIKTILNFKPNLLYRTLSKIKLQYLSILFYIFLSTYCLV